MTTFITLVGISGAGKSTLAKKLSEEYSAVIIESDSVRERLYGSAEKQGDNNELFDLIHKEIIENLSNGKNVIFDAVNIWVKNRISLLQKLNTLDVKKICYVVATQYEKCLEQNNKRYRRVPEYVINRMWKSFQVPVYAEGWDQIEIEYKYKKEDYKIVDYLNLADGFNQHNPHHSLTLGEHSRLVAKHLEGYKVDKHIWYAGLLHDVGKLNTLTFKDTKGNITEVAHYYNHENCGAYESLFYMGELWHNTKDVLFVAGLINYHMRMYNLKTNKATKKLLNIVGEDLFYFLTLLHDCDKKSH